MKNQLLPEIAMLETIYAKPADDDAESLAIMYLMGCSKKSLARDLIFRASAAQVEQWADMQRKGGK